MPDNEPVQWEYEVVEMPFDPGLKAMLNAMGEQGWELIAQTNATERPAGVWTTKTVAAMVFKRPKQT